MQENPHLLTQKGTKYHKYLHIVIKDRLKQNKIFTQNNLLQNSVMEVIVCI